MRATTPEPTLENFAAICKECGAGTLNNSAIPLFKLFDYTHEEVEEYFIQCKCCGSTHVDVEVL